MALIRNLKLAAVSAAALLGTVGMAQAQTCTETELNAAEGEAFLRAQNLLIVDKNPQAALQALNAFKALNPNCYGQGQALLLGAQIKIQTGDSAGAANDLEQALNRGFLPPSNRTQTLLTLAQLNLQATNYPKAKQYYDRWIQAGGQPNRDQQWRLAVINYKLGSKSDAVRWAEAVYRIDGSSAGKEVTDFLIQLYNETGNKAKLAQLVETLIQRYPNEKKYWLIVAANYNDAGEERRAFEVYKAMYLGGLLTDEAEILNIVNFYNRFDVPYEAAKTLEQEMNRGRVSKTFERLDQLANLYQVAKEPERAIPVIREAAQLNGSGRVFERLGRAQMDLEQYDEAISSFNTAIQKGSLRQPGMTRVLLGQAHHALGNRADARDAFGAARRFQDGRSGASGWLNFMAQEDATERAVLVSDARNKASVLETEKRSCEEGISTFGEEVYLERNPACADVEARFETARDEYERLLDAG